MASDALLLKFKDTDTVNTVTRAAVREMSRTLGFNETQLVQYALAKLRAEVLPAYVPDEGPVPQAMLRHIRKTVKQTDYQPSRSLLPGI